MRQRVFGIAVIAVLLSGIWANTGRCEDFLEAGFDRYEAPAGIVHDIFIEANKDGATTCQLITPTGTYSFINVGGAFRPGQDFFDDLIGLSLAELQAAISGGWTLTWDAGPSQTVATIDFGTIAEDDFLPLPIITAPLDTIEIPRDPNPPTIEWINGSDPRCGFALALLADSPNWWNAQSLTHSGELTCSITSWTPVGALVSGTWFVSVMNSYAAPDVDGGIIVIQGTWPIINPGGWLDYGSVDRAQNEVVPTESKSWGAIKALFERER